MTRNDELAPIPSPGSRNPNKLQNLRPGQGAEARKKHGRSLANKVRRFLVSSKYVDEQGRNLLHQMLDTLASIATDRKHPHAVAAAQELLNRGFGKPRPSDEELDASKKGILTVYCYNPELADVPFGPAERPEHKLDPEFINAEVITEGE